MRAIGVVQSVVQNMNIKEKVLEVLTNEPQKQKEILYELKKQYDLKVTDRALRRIFNAINNEYILGSSEVMVVSNCTGCWITSDIDEISRYNKSKRHHALSELYQSYNSEKRLMKNSQMSFEEFLKGEEYERI